MLLLALWSSSATTLRRGVGSGNGGVAVSKAFHSSLCWRGNTGQLLRKHVIIPPLCMSSSANSAHDMWFIRQCQFSSNSMKSSNPSIPSPSSSSSGHSTKESSSTEAAKLPTFKGISLDRIVAVSSLQELAEAKADLLQQKVIGFDTEAKPNYQRAKAHQGPHLLQLSTHNKVYLFSTTISQGIQPTHREEKVRKGRKSSLRDDSVEQITLAQYMKSVQQQVDFRKAMLSFLKHVIESKDIIKVGFGLSFDRFLMQSNLQIDLQNELDLCNALRVDPKDNQVGIRRAIKLYLGQEIMKSKTITHSNWSRAIKELTDKQKLYAANDAYASLMIYDAWKQHCDQGGSNLRDTHMDEEHRRRLEKLQDLMRIHQANQLKLQMEAEVRAANKAATAAAAAAAAAAASVASPSIPSNAAASDGSADGAVAVASSEK